MFMVDMHARGVTVRPLRQMTGGAAFNEVFLDDVWAPDSDRLGEVGEGWRVMLTTLGHERRSIGGQGYGGVGLLSPQRYIDLAEAYGRSRDPVVRQHLAQLVTYLRLSKWNSQRGLGFGKLERHHRGFAILRSICTSSRGRRSNSTSLARQEPRRRVR